MTARLSPLQRQVLEQLAHIRVAPEDAWMTTGRLEQLAGRGLRRTLWSLLARGLIAETHFGSASELDAWRITDKGREALG